MSHGDGWPTYLVEFEHLADRRMRLWLLEGGSRFDLGTLTGTRGCWPVVKERVGAALGLAGEDYLVELRVPRPPYLHAGDDVVVRLEDGRQVPARVIGWVNGEVWLDTVRPEDGGSGMFALDDLVLPSS